MSFSQPLIFYFLTISKKYIFTIVEYFFKKSIFFEENFLRGLVFFYFSKICSTLKLHVGKTTSCFVTFFLGHLLVNFLASLKCNSSTQGSQRVAKKWLPLLHYPPPKKKRNKSPYSNPLLKI